MAMVTAMMMMKTFVVADDGDGDDDYVDDGKRPLLAADDCDGDGDGDDDGDDDDEDFLNTPTLEVLPNLGCQVRPEANQLKTGASRGGPPPAPPWKQRSR